MAHLLTKGFAVAGIIEWLSGVWIYLILVLAMLNGGLWWYLRHEARRASRECRDWLANVVRPFSRRRDVRGDADVLDAVESFLADIRDVIKDPSTSDDLAELRQRVVIKGESPPGKLPHLFERWYGVCRAGVESFPLLGILGTVLAIAAGMHAAADGDSASSISKVVDNFGESVYCTGCGIFFAIVFSLVNGWCESGFDRVIRHSHEIDELVIAVKKRVGLSAE